MLLMRDPGSGLGPLMLMMRAPWGVVHGYPSLPQECAKHAKLEGLTLLLVFPALRPPQLDTLR